MKSVVEPTDLETQSFGESLLSVEDVIDSADTQTCWAESVGPTAALVTLDVFQMHDVPGHIAEIGRQVQDGLAAIAAECSAPLESFFLAAVRDVLP